MARRNFRPRIDPLETMRESEIIQRFRFNRDGIQFLTEELMDALSPMTNRNLSFPTQTKVLTTLRYLASGQIQLNAGDMNGMSQASVSRIITKTVASICDPTFSTRFIIFPTQYNQLIQRKREFYEISGFPNVIGVIDGTHVQLRAPSVDEPAYVNMMGYHSINTQLVFDSQGLILDLVARWPGSTHDSRVLRNSGLWELMERAANRGDHYLLGDSGYPCKRWLLTPYLRPNEGAQRAYNRAHKSTRCCVERGIGQLKKRWGILQGEIRMEPAKVCQMIMACGVLHNICRMRNIPMPEQAVPLEPQEPAVVQEHNLPPQDGLRFRDYVCNMHL